MADTSIRVRFLYGCAPFNATEQAGFSAEEAARLVARGVAEYSDSKDAAAAPPISSDPAPVDPSIKPAGAEALVENQDDAAKDMSDGTRNKAILKPGSRKGG